MKKTIWIIDDDPGILEVIELILNEEGYRTKIIANGSDLHKTLRKEKPHLILLDVLMSGIDGRDISRKLKDHPDTKTIPVVIMSADMNVDQKAKEALADGYVRKPFDIEGLMTVVKKHIF